MSLWDRWRYQAMWGCGIGVSWLEDKLWPLGPAIFFEHFWDQNISVNSLLNIEWETKYSSCKIYTDTFWSHRFQTQAESWPWWVQFFEQVSTYYQNRRADSRRLQLKIKNWHLQLYSISGWFSVTPESDFFESHNICSQSSATRLLKKWESMIF